MIPNPNAPNNAGYVPRRVWVVVIHEKSGGCRVHPEGFLHQDEANRKALQLNRSGLRVEVFPVEINSWGNFDSQLLWFGKD
jgi:hypothetical protein